MYDDCKLKNPFGLLVCMQIFRLMSAVPHFREMGGQRVRSGKHEEQSLDKRWKTFTTNTQGLKVPIFMPQQFAYLIPPPPPLKLSGASLFLLYKNCSHYCRRIKLAMVDSVSVHNCQLHDSVCRPLFVRINLQSCFCDECT